MRKFEVVEDKFRKNKYSKIQIPERATKWSAGYDFYCPIDILIKAGKSVLIFSDIKAKMNKDEVLLLFVRSSIGIKEGIVLSNGTGIIDSDYYYGDNGGNIGLPLKNTTDKDIIIQAGKRIAQGIFTKYLIVTDEDISKLEDRSGGFGSSGK